MHIRVNVAGIIMKDDQVLLVECEDQSGLHYLFNCTLKTNSQPHMPDQPDALQTGVRWVALDKLNDVVLYPQLGQDLLRMIRGELDNLFYGKV